MNTTNLLYPHKQKNETIKMILKLKKTLFEQKELQKPAGCTCFTALQTWFFSECYVSFCVWVCLFNHFYSFPVVFCYFSSLESCCTSSFVITFCLHLGPSHLRCNVAMEFHFQWIRVIIDKLNFFKMLNFFMFLCCNCSLEEFPGGII